MKPTIIFVYNANSGLFNTLGDMAHKVFSPQTYACNLCGITHTPLGMKNEWKEYLESLHVKKVFLHADELKNQYGIENVELPALFLEADAKAKLWIKADEINSCKSIDELKTLIDSKLDRLDENV